MGPAGWYSASKAAKKAPNSSFVGENGVLGGERMFDGVVADGGASFGILGAGAVQSVAAIGFELTVGDHGSWLGSSL